MKTTINNFDCLADALIFENLNFTSQAGYTPGPGDESDDEETDTNEDNSTAAPGDDNPPLDEEVVHSPLTTQPGGKPKQ